VSENRALRKILGPKRDEVMAGSRKLHNDELHNLYFSSGIIRMIKSRMMRRAGHVERMGQKECILDIGWKSRRKDATRKT
jgi:hypothetical protein